MAVGKSWHGNEVEKCSKSALFKTYQKILRSFNSSLSFMAGEVRIDVTLNEGVSQSINSKLLNSCIEYLIYQRQQVPLPFHELKRIVEDQERNDLEAGDRGRPLARRSLSTEYRKAIKVYQDLQCLFDHINKLFSSTTVNSAMIILGSTPVSPKEHYFVTFPRTKQATPADDISTRVSNSACRKMIQSLISNQELGSFKDISPTSMLVFIQASRTSDVEWFRPKPAFKPPHRGQSCRITLTTACSGQQMTDSAPPDDHCTDDCLWFQAPIIIRGYRQRAGAGL